MFSVDFGITKRETEILKISETDPNTGVILAAVHFEWMIKHSILKLGCSPTKELKEELEKVYKLAIPKAKKGDYRSV